MRCSHFLQPSTTCCGSPPGRRSSIAGRGRASPGGCSPPCKLEELELEELRGIGVSQHFLTVAGAKRSRVIGCCRLDPANLQAPAPAGSQSWAQIALKILSCQVLR